MKKFFQIILYVLLLLLTLPTLIIPGIILWMLVALVLDFKYLISNMLSGKPRVKDDCYYGPF